MEKNVMKGILFAVDKSIINSINEKKSFFDIHNDLDKRCISIFNVVKDDYKSIDELLSTKLDDNVPRDRYVFNYITCCRKRSKDLKWLVENRTRFRKNLKDIELFNLIKFKDKLSNETR